MKSVLITGASTGFGRTMTTEFLDAGWHVFATLRGGASRRELFAADLEKHRERLAILSLDVTVPAERDGAVEQVRARGQGLDCLVNNAGYGLFGALEDTTEAQLRHQFEVNFFGAALLTRALLPMLRERRGTVVNVSSMMGYLPFPLATAYCASKAALGVFTEALHYELAPHGVRVHLVEPGGYRTEFGTNMTWGEGNSETYALETAGYRRFRDKLRQGRSKPPAVLARRVVKLVDKQTRRVRRPMGADAVAADLFIRLAPEGLQRLLLGSFFRRAFRSPA